MKDNKRSLKKSMSVIFMCAVLVLSAILIANPPRVSAAPDDWTEATDTDFQDTFDAGVPWVNDLVLVGSGASAYIELDRKWNWNDMNPASNPGKRTGFAMAYDSKNDVVVMFGGYLDGTGVTNDTWEYDYNTNQWTQIIADGAAGSPPPRELCKMDYDSTNEVIVLWGGVDAVGARLADTWEYDVDTKAWLETTPKPSPPGMGGYGLAYDSTNSRILVSGTNEVPPAGVLHLWSYDASINNWTERASTSTARAGHDMAYNGNEMIVQGGAWGAMGEIQYDDTLVYDYGTDSWTRHNYDGDLTTLRPGFRTGNAMARFFDGVYDVSGDNGFIFPQDFWNYTGIGRYDWVDESPLGMAPKPSGREMHGLVFWDSTDKCLILYGGADFFGRSNETWAYCKGYASAGDYISRIGATDLYFDSGVYPEWLNIWWNDTSQPIGTKLKFQLWGDNNTIPGDGSPGDTMQFVGPDGTAGTYYETAGAAIWNGLNYLRYIRYRAYFEGTFSNTPKFDDISITYNYTGPPYIKSTDPADNDVDVPLWKNITVIFSTSMNTGTLTWTIDPDPTGWSVVWSTTTKTDDTATFSHSTAFEECTKHMFTITYVEDILGSPLDPVAGKPNPWNFTTVCIPPYIDKTDPFDGETGVELTRAVEITFSEKINKTTFAFNIVPPDLLGWTWVWTVGDTVVTGTHSVDFTESTPYTFTVIAADDMYGNSLVAGPVPNPWDWTTLDATNPEIVGTAPFDTETSVALDQTIQISFSEEMNPATFVWDGCTPNPGNWSWNWISMNSIAEGTHDNFAELTVYTCTVLAAEDVAGLPLVAGAIPNPFWFETEVTSPFIVVTDPMDNAVGVPLDRKVNITFSQPMNTASFSWTCSPDPGGWSWFWDAGDTIAVGSHIDFAANTKYMFTVTGALNKAGDPIVLGPAPNPFNFTTGIVDVPSNLRVLRSGSDIVLNWDAVSGATLYNVYESQDRFAAWPWALEGTVTPPNTAYSHTGAHDDGLTHYYIVRAVAGGNETDNSTMGVKTELSFSMMPPGMTDIYWMSLPYDSDYTKASDISGELGSGKITSVGKWDRAKHKVVTYSFAKGKWRGPDFAINAGDGIFVGGIQMAFDWVIVGTDFETPLDFTSTPKRARNYNWISVPYTGIYDSASEIVTDIEGSLFASTKISEIGLWDPVTQSAIIFKWDGMTWSGTDFAFNPGDGIYLLVRNSFSWTPLLITPAV